MWLCVSPAPLARSPGDVSHQEVIFCLQRKREKKASSGGKIARHQGASLVEIEIYFLTRGGARQSDDFTNASVSSSHLVWTSSLEDLVCFTKRFPIWRQRGHFCTGRPVRNYEYHTRTVVLLTRGVSDEFNPPAIDGFNNNRRLVVVWMWSVEGHTAVQYRSPLHHRMSRTERGDVQ